MYRRAKAVIDVAVSAPVLAVTVVLCLLVPASARAAMPAPMMPAGKPITLPLGQLVAPRTFGFRGPGTLQIRAELKAPGPMAVKLSVKSGKKLVHEVPVLRGQPGNARISVAEGRQVLQFTVANALAGLGPQRAAPINGTATIVYHEGSTQASAKTASKSRPKKAPEPKQVSAKKASGQKQALDNTKPSTQPSAPPNPKRVGEEAATKPTPPSPSPPGFAAGKPALGTQPPTSSHPTSPPSSAATPAPSTGHGGDSALARPEPLDSVGLSLRHHVNEVVKAQVLLYVQALIESGAIQPASVEIELHNQAEHAIEILETRVLIDSGPVILQTVSGSSPVSTAESLRLIPGAHELSAEVKVRRASSSMFGRYDGTVRTLSIRKPFFVHAAKLYRVVLDVQYSSDWTVDFRHRLGLRAVIPAAEQGIVSAAMCRDGNSAQAQSGKPPAAVSSKPKPEDPAPSAARAVDEIKAAKPPSTSPPASAPSAPRVDRKPPPSVGNASERQPSSAGKPAPTGNATQ